MSSLLTSFVTGVSGIRVAQSGLNVSAHNIANTDTEAEYKVWQMYNDFGTDEYDLDDLIVWQPKNDENYREDYPDVMEIVY